MLLRVRTSRGTKKLEVPSDCTVEGLRQRISTSKDLGLEENEEFEISTEFPGMSKEAKILKNYSESLVDVGFKHGDLCYVIQSSPPSVPQQDEDQKHSSKSNQRAVGDAGKEAPSPTSSSRGDAVYLERDPDEEATLALVKRLEREEREALGAGGGSGYDHYGGGNSSSSSNDNDGDNVRSPEPPKTMNLVGDDLQDVARRDAELIRSMNGNFVNSGSDHDYPRDGQRLYARMGMSAGAGALGFQAQGGILSYGGDNYEDDMQKALRLSILDGQRSGKIHAYMELVCVFFCVYIYFY